MNLRKFFTRLFASSTLNVRTTTTVKVTYNGKPVELTPEEEAAVIAELESSMEGVTKAFEKMSDTLEKRTRTVP